MSALYNFSQPAWDAAAFAYNASLFGRYSSTASAYFLLTYSSLNDTSRVSCPKRLTSSPILVAPRLSYMCNCTFYRFCLVCAVQVSTYTNLFSCSGDCARASDASRLARAALSRTRGGAFGMYASVKGSKIRERKNCCATCAPL